VNVRPITESDLPALVTLLREDESAIFGRPSHIGLADLKAWTARTDLANDSWLFEEDGEPVAVSWFERFGDLGIFVGAVAQAAKGRGLGSRIVETAEARAREREAARAHTFALEPDATAAELLGQHGFLAVRRFYEMAIELDEEPVVPELPDGFILEKFDADRVRAFHATLTAAFQDHWEPHPLPFDEWWEQKQRAPDFDPTLWFFIRTGEDVAAVIRNDPERGGGGYVAALGVAREWRGRGLARALLYRTFAEFWSRGVKRVSLGVDAESPTGATKLYESVGMTVESAGVVFEKALT
jgi:mycothiol synthase